MTDEMREQKTYVWKMPESKTLTGTALLEMPTLRDQFAMVALNAMLTRQSSPENLLAKLAYGYADAMLAARKEA